MASFTDTKGRAWTVSLDVLTVRRVKTALEVSIADIDQALLDRVRSEPLFLADLVWEIVKPQAQSAGIDLLDFCGGLDGDTLDAAIEALLEAVVNFSRSPQRPVLRRMLARMAVLEGLAREEAVSRLEGPEIEQAVKAAIASIGPASSSPASPASNPGATASAS